MRDQSNYYPQTVSNDLDQRGSNLNEDRHTHSLRTVGNGIDQHLFEPELERGSTHMLHTVGNDLNQHGLSSEYQRNAMSQALSTVLQPLHHQLVFYQDVI